MARTKRINQQNFDFTLPDGTPVSIAAWYYETSTSWGHKARIYIVGDEYPNFERRIRYENRTWESFKYESMLKKIINDYFTGKKNELNRAFLKKQLDAIAQHESEKCDAFIKAFTAAYDGLTESQKQRLADSDIEITNEKQADIALATIQAMALLNA